MQDNVNKYIIERFDGTNESQKWTQLFRVDMDTGLIMDPRFSDKGEAEAELANYRMCYPDQEYRLTTIEA